MYEKYPSYDLSDRKDFIKGTVKEVKTFSCRKHSGFFCVLFRGVFLRVSGCFGCDVLVLCFFFFSLLQKVAWHPVTLVLITCIVLEV